MESIESEFPDELTLQSKPRNVAVLFACLSVMAIAATGCESSADYDPNDMFNQAGMND